MIEAYNAEWASPVVIIPNLDGTQRFCIEDRNLNESTVNDIYLLPRVYACLDSLGGANMPSTLN